MWYYNAELSFNYERNYFLIWGQYVCFTAENLVVGKMMKIKCNVSVYAPEILLFLPTDYGVV